MKMGMRRWVALLRSGDSLLRTADLMKFSGMDFDAVRKASLRLTRDGLLIKVGKELYANGLLPPPLLDIGLSMRLPCYVSMGSVLQAKGLWELAPQALELVTLGRPGGAETPLGTLQYFHVSRDLYWGFEEVNGRCIALPEKALLDLLYLDAQGSIDSLLAGQLAFDKLNTERLDAMQSHFPATVALRLRRLRRLQRRAGMKGLAPTEQKFS